MSNPQRPMALAQRKIIGKATLREIGAEVDLLALATDLNSPRNFYVVQSKPDTPPFGVWPEELQDIRWAMPLEV